MEFKGEPSGDSFGTIRVDVLRLLFKVYKIGSSKGFLRDYRDPPKFSTVTTVQHS